VTLLGLLLALQAAEGEPVRVLRSHAGWVSALAWSPDGKLLASGGDDGAVRLWDSATGKELRVLRGPAHAVTALAFSPDGKRLVAGHWDGTLRAWDPAEGKPLSARRAHEEAVVALAWSPDGKELASGSADDTLRIRDAGDGEERLSLRPAEEYDVTALAWSPDGRRLASGDGEDAVRVWDPETGEERLRLRGHEGVVSSVAWSPDGSRLASASWDGTVRVWDAGAGKELLVFRGHGADAASVAWSPDGRLLASGGEDKAARVWDARTGKELLAWGGHPDHVTAVAWSPDGRRLAAASRGAVSVRELLAPIAGVHRAEAVEASPVLTSAGMAWWEGRLILADRVSRSLLAFTPPDRFEAWKTLTHPVGVAVDAGGHLLVTEKEKGGVCRVVRFRKDGREETLAEEGAGSPHFLAAHPNGTVYWSGFPDGGTRYLLPGAKEVSVAEPRVVHTYGIGLSPGRDWLYVNSKIPNPDRRGTWRFPVDREGRLGAGELFLRIETFTTGHLDGLPAAVDGSPSLKGWVGRLQGLAVDRLGYLYVGGAESHTSGSAVAVFTPDGKALAAMIVGVPRNLSGLAFGGPDGRTLYVTGAGEYKLHQARLPVPGEVFRD